MRVLATIPLRNNRELELAIEALARISLEQINAQPFPGIYSGKIKYQREPTGLEYWQPAIDTYARGIGDCEDLAALYLAECWKKGIFARADVLTVTPYLKHVRVRMPDGTIIDPSKALGMQGEG